MNGTIVAVQAKLNTEVSKGDTLLIMEAMKMEHKVIAPADGKVTEFYFQEGDIIDGGIELLAFEAATA
jgi:3-methylcrotonyl-CoA carboxylase alpha subunit